MLPQTTFVTVGTVTLTVKVFVNRAATDTLYVSINAKSPVTLREYSHARLSNHQIDVVVNETLHDELRAVLSETPLKELIPTPVSMVDVVKHRGKDKYTLKVPVSVILSVRLDQDLLSGNDSRHLDSMGLQATFFNKGSMRLITKETTMTKLLVEDEEVPEKSIEYKLYRHRTVSTPESIAIFIN